jgi:hydrogenase maturation protein HypF
MARDLGQARRVARIGAVARRSLLSPARPIVLAPRRQGSPLAPSIAPGLAEVGLFLPASALQEVLLRLGPPLQVMTSGNRSGEPIACDDADAVARLFGVADLLLVHDRAIHTRADDSVVRVIGDAAVPLRRARGFVPASFDLPVAGPPILAVGAQDRATVCVARGGKAILSQHLGDLDDPDSLAFFEETIRKLCRLAGVEPVAVAHDLHPDLRSTRWARASGLPRLPVQHHHAHVAACLCENGAEGPAIGVAFDGTGAGPDGASWGGEVLLADLRGFRRLHHLSSIALPGGEAAIREPWRLAVAALAEAGEPVDLPDAGRILPLLARAPRATGAGRWFDAVSALCGIRRMSSYEGQAAVELEAAAASGTFRPYPFHLGQEIELRPTIRAIAADLRRRVPVSEIAARFHETMAACIHAACLQALAAGAPPRVVLSGGCFANRRLSERATALLEHDGLEVYRHRAVPPGDGGISLGQAAVASALLSGEAH